MTHKVDNMRQAARLVAGLAKTENRGAGDFIVAVTRRGLGRRQWYEDNTAAVCGLLAEYGIEYEVRNNSPLKAISGRYIHIL